MKTDRNGVYLTAGDLLAMLIAPLFCGLFFKFMGLECMTAQALTAAGYLAFWYLVFAAYDVYSQYKESKDSGVMPDHKHKE